MAHLEGILFHDHKFLAFEFYFPFCNLRISVLLPAGLTNLESLNLDSCKISDEGLANLTGLFS